MVMARTREITHRRLDGAVLHGNRLTTAWKHGVWGFASKSDGLSNGLAPGTAPASWGEPVLELNGSFAHSRGDWDALDGFKKIIRIACVTGPQDRARKSRDPAKNYEGVTPLVCRRCRLL
jgi:hypothetical protein